MWWLDDNLYRGNPGDKGRMPYRASLSRPVGKRPVSKPSRSITSELTEPQKAANRILLEAEADHPSQTERLLADIRSLENAVRQHVAQREELESKVEKQIASHAEQLTEAINNSQLAIESQNFEHNQESQQLHERLAAAEGRNSEQAHELQQLRERLAAAEQRNSQQIHESRQLRDLLAEDEKRVAEQDHEAKQLRERLTATENLVAQKNALVTAVTADANQLRKLLAAAEATVGARESEFAELEMQLDAREQHYVARLTETEHEHAAESEYLRSIASSAENRAIDRNRVIATLEAELATRQALHSAELVQLRNTFEINQQSENSRLMEARNRVQIQAEEIAELKTHVELLQEENESRRNQLQVACHAKEAAEHNFNEIVEQHSSELLDLKSRIDQLQFDLDSALAEKSSLEATATQKACEQSATIAELKNQIAAVTADGQRSDLSALELRQQTVTLQSTIDRLRNSAVECESLRESEIAKLRRSIERTQDGAIEEARRAKQIESALRARSHTLEKSVERLTCEVAESRNQHQHEVSTLQQTIEKHRSEIELLAAEAEQAVKELDRKEGALQRARSKNERLLEIHDSQFTTMRSRIDDLVVALDVETDKRSTAESEVRRLGATRSRRLAFLGQQREQLLAQAIHLRSENKLLREKVDQLRSVAETTEWSLEKATNGLRAQASEIRELRGRLDAAATAESEKLQQRLEKHAAATREIVQLNMLLDESKEELRACRQQLTQGSTEQTEFAIVQRERTIALLEQEAVVMQKRLHREAAARRKAEGAIKRKVNAENLDTAVQDAWSDIDAREQVSRLKRRITALENIGLLERQRAAAEISRYKKHIKRLQQPPGNRAA